MRRLIDIAAAALLVACGNPASAAPKRPHHARPSEPAPYAHTAFALINDVTAEPQVAIHHAVENDGEVQELSDRLVDQQLGAIEEALLACYKRSRAPATAKLTFAVTKAGTTTDVVFVHPDRALAACVARVLVKLQFPPLDIPRFTATMTVELVAGPRGCDAVWRLGSHARACKRGDRMDLLALVDGALQVTDSIQNVTTVYDATGEDIVIAGPCMLPDENAANAVCWIGSPSSPGASPGMGTTYLFPETPGFPRGVVVWDANYLVASNGRHLAFSAYDNMNSKDPIDVQAELVAAGIKPSSCEEWPVITPLHRESGKLVIAFRDCNGQDVLVALEDEAGKVHWRKQEP